MITHPNVTRAALLAALVLLPLCGVAAQEGVDLKEIARQIRRNMITVEESLHTLDGTKAREAAGQAAKDIDRLVENPDGEGSGQTSDGSAGGGSGKREDIRRRGEQVVKDIDRIIEGMEPSGGGGGGGGQQQQKQKQSGKQHSRDRNQSQRKGEKPQEKGQNGPEKNEGPDPKDGRNERSRQPEQPDPEEARHVQMEKKWGFLPPEQRQRLIDRNFKDFTPEYELEIRAYFKKIAERAK